LRYPPHTAVGFNAASAVLERGLLDFEFAEDTATGFASYAAVAPDRAAAAAAA
jgi:hypothetical protein